MEKSVEMEMKEQIEKIEHGLMVCEVTGTELVHIEKADAEKILALLKDQEPKPVELHTNAYGTKFYFCPKCKRELFHTRDLNFCEKCGLEVEWE